MEFSHEDVKSLFHCSIKFSRSVQTWGKPIFIPVRVSNNSALFTFFMMWKICGEWNRIVGNNIYRQWVFRLNSYNFFLVFLDYIKCMKLLLYHLYNWGKYIAQLSNFFWELMFIGSRSHKIGVFYFKQNNLSESFAVCNCFDRPCGIVLGLNPMKNQGLRLLRLNHETRKVGN